MKHRPLTIVVFGSTGDLYKKKLARALFDLYKKNLMPERFNIVAHGRRSHLTEDFRSLTKEALGAGADEFLKHVLYHKGEITQLSDYRALAGTLEKIDKENSIISDKIFYLAVSPKFYEPILQNLHDSGISKSQESEYVRILVEKPFGNDLEHSTILEKLVSSLFKEDQVFRIDHYLAKHSLQKLLDFRFAGATHEALWNKDHIEKVELRFLETHIVGDRGASYDLVGALRDVGSNHMLAMLSFVAMENPSKETSVSVAREKVLTGLDLFKGEKAIFARAQYDGYIQEKGVAEASQTETYFKATLGLDNERWKGIPFYLEAGKAFDQASVDIKIFFKSTVKNNPENLTFSMQESSNTLGAYEKVFIDAMAGDQTLFTSPREVLLQWRIAEKILAKLKTLPLLHYKKGSKAFVLL